ncbi:helix-turn-helix domain-containing protein [Acidovorax soli]|uniref:helix-turn-helix domain-containing protein n=1 Tax=Acidovorax soli TaxID=592050 RepID=UPI001114EF84|nr:helix-turn-helix transcriptional regulator [Acidovorax soli]
MVSDGLGPLSGGSKPLSELAQRTGLSSLAVRQILSGTSAPRITNAMALAQELGLELVLVPTVVADGLERPPKKAQRTVVTDLERLLGIRPDGSIGQGEGHG